MFGSKKYEYYSSLSVKIPNLSKLYGLNVELLNSTDKFSTIKISFGLLRFSRYLLIWNKEIVNRADYLDLINIASQFKKGNWLIVGNSLIDDNGEDKWEQFQIETKKSLKDNMRFSGEHYKNL